ncbi:MAG: ABC transporter permease subunit [Verrucomicrobiota bacterium]
MRGYFTLFKKELASYFVSPVAYMVLLATSLVIGVYFWILVNYFINAHIKEVTILFALFNVPFFWNMIVVMCPVITMRIFSEEFKLGTIEMLLTAPISEWQIVLAKFTAAVTFFMIAWSPILLNMGWLHVASPEKIQISWGMVVLPFVMLFLVGSFYLAIGLFTSVLTKNQIVSAIMSFALIYVLYSLSFIPFVTQNQDFNRFFEYTSVLNNMNTFSLGTFDTRPVVYLLSGTGFFLLLTQRILLSKRLKA